MSWLSDLLAIAGGVAEKLAPAATTRISIAGATVTVGEIETATGSLTAFFSAMQAAVKTKNLEAGAELTIEELVAIAADLGLGEPFTGIAKSILPLLFGAFNQIAAEPLIPDGRGGFVTKTWADDPREQLNPDGSFKN